MSAAADVRAAPRPSPLRTQGPSAFRAAIEAVLAGKPAPSEQRPSIGCSIKWKIGNEPDY